MTLLLLYFELFLIIRISNSIMITLTVYSILKLNYISIRINRDKDGFTPEFSTCIVVIISFDKIKFTLTQRASFQSIHFRSKLG